MVHAPRCALALGLFLGTPPVASAGVAPAPPLFIAPALEGTLNLNTATETQLTLLPGVGPTTARKILAYRAKRPFARVSQLMRIKGIGKKTFGRLRRYLAVSGENTLRTLAPGST